MDLGESLVAAYVRHVRGCDLILKNVHLAGVQGELDVVALERGPQQRVWLCEVTTHIRGMNNPAKRSAVQRVREKVERASNFAHEVFPGADHCFEVWSPRVRPGLVAELRVVVERLAVQRSRSRTCRQRCVYDEDPRAYRSSQDSIKHRRGRLPAI